MSTRLINNKIKAKMMIFCLENALFMMEAQLISVIVPIFIAKQIIMAMNIIYVIKKAFIFIVQGTRNLNWNLLIWVMEHSSLAPNAIMK